MEVIEGQEFDGFRKLMTEMTKVRDWQGSSWRPFSAVVSQGCQAQLQHGKYLQLHSVWQLCCRACGAHFEATLSQLVASGNQAHNLVRQ